MFCALCQSFVRSVAEQENCSSDVFFWCLNFGRQKATILLRGLCARPFISGSPDHVWNVQKASRVWCSLLMLSFDALLFYLANHGHSVALGPVFMVAFFWSLSYPNDRAYWALGRRSSRALFVLHWVIWISNKDQNRFASYRLSWKSSLSLFNLKARFYL